MFTCECPPRSAISANLRRTFLFKANIQFISYNVAMIMLHALHIDTNKKPNGISPVGFLFVNVATIPTASKGI